MPSREQFSQGDITVTVRKHLQYYRFSTDPLVPLLERFKMSLISDRCCTVCYHNYGTKPRVCFLMQSFCNWSDDSR